MIIEGKAYNKYLKPKRGKAKSIDLRDHCLSLKLDADRVVEIGYLTALLNAHTRGGRVVIYRKKKKVCEFSRPDNPYESH